MSPNTEGHQRRNLIHINQSIHIPNHSLPPHTQTHPHIHIVMTAQHVWPSCTDSLPSQTPQDFSLFSLFLYTSFPLRHFMCCNNEVEREKIYIWMNENVAIFPRIIFDFKRENSDIFMKSGVIFSHEIMWKYTLISERDLVCHSKTWVQSEINAE